MVATELARVENAQAVEDTKTVEGDFIDKSRKVLGACNTLLAQLERSPTQKVILQTSTLQAIEQMPTF